MDEKKTAVVVPAKVDVSVAAPVAQEISRNETVDLSLVSGVVIRQDTQFLESFAAGLGVPYEGKNRYAIAAMPEGRTAASDPHAGDKWVPTGQELKSHPDMLRAHEESNMCERIVLNGCGCGNLRNLKLHYFNPSGANNGADELLQTRPFLLGAGCCCPIVSTVDKFDANGRTPLGEVKEDCAPCSLQWLTRCCQLTCCCTTYNKISTYEQGVLQPKYTLRTNLACCGRTNNCFGATCICNDAVFDILDQEGNVVAHVQKTYAGDGCGSLLRMCLQFSNYIVSFPEGATHEERSMILAAVMHNEYLLFEKTGDEND